MPTGWRELGGNRVSLFSARDFNIRQMQSDNVILLGSTRANPVGGSAQRPPAFPIMDSIRRCAIRISRTVRRPGEQPIYRSDATTSLCQIALLPNLSQTGYILVIAGSEVEGTEAGGEFLTNERSDRPLDVGHSQGPQRESFRRLKYCSGASAWAVWLRASRLSTRRRSDCKPLRVLMSEWSASTDRNPSLAVVRLRVR